jgi:hypothetical protein
VIKLDLDVTTLRYNIDYAIKNGCGQAEAVFQEILRKKKTE